jgi:hypothetical protein
MADGTVAKIALTSRAGVEGTTKLVFRTDVVTPDYTKATYFSDMSAQPVWPHKVDSVNIYIDGTLPVASFEATQNGANVLSGTPGAAQVTAGTVLITVTASDAFSGLDVASPVTVSIAGIVVTTVVEGPAGVFTCTATITAATAQGPHAVEVTVTDKAGNATVLNGSLYVNITGQVELEGFVGTARTVTFVATGGAETKTWLQSLSFVGGVATYTLPDVPAGTTGISAKTAWNLRRKLAVSGAEPTGVNFTGASKLLGGDLDGSNSVNILDYSVLKLNWFGSAPQADINGDGTVNVNDYSLLRLNWFKIGDAE